MKVLRIDASARNSGSHSRALMDRLIEGLGARAEVRVRDLTQPLPQVDEAWVAAKDTLDAERSEIQREALSLSDQLVDELEGSDLIVIGLPVYNFGVPASLKAWIDQVCRARRTFTYSERGPVGLLKGKRAVVFFVSGGTPMGSDIDFASGYLRHVLGFIGIDKVQFIRADRHMLDPDILVHAAEEADRIAADLRSKMAA